MPKVREPVVYFVRFVVPGPGTLGYLGEDYDRGEIITLQGMESDERLLRLGYIGIVEQHRLITPCGVCGKQFLDERMRDQHGTRRHRMRFMDDLDVVAQYQTHMGVAGARDITGDAEEKQLMAEAPLYLDKTKASQDA